MLRRTHEAGENEPRGLAEERQRSGSHSIYEIKRPVYETAGRCTTLMCERQRRSTAGGASLRIWVPLAPSEAADPIGEVVGVVSRLFNFRAVHQRRSGSYARAADRTGRARSGVGAPRSPCAGTGRWGQAKSRSDSRARRALAWELSLPGRRRARPASPTG